MRALRGAAALMMSVATPALAGPVPLYQAPPGWVAPAPEPRVAQGQTGAPAIVLRDQQVRVEKGQVWSYVDTAVRADTPEALTRLGTLTAVWLPDKGDFIVHRAVIERRGQTIDLLARGRFSVLQRETRLERRVLDGALTATLPVAGLEVGDVLRFAYSVTQADAALGGKAQVLMLPPVAPAAIGTGRLRVTWPQGEKVGWRLTPDPVIDPARPGAAQPAPVPVHDGHGDMVLTLPLPLPKRAPLPADAPARFRHPPLLQVGTFADWADVSRTLAPLFATEGAIAPDSPVARTTDAIMAATPDPRARAARALERVQSDVSYLLLGMNGGNYVPQPVAETWEKRFGDCKAKTLLLLAMLRRMGITAEPVLAASSGGDALPTVLPMAAAFDHVLVHAVIGGRDLWLDGTALGSRIADLDDVPAFDWVLPLRRNGAGLIRPVWRAPQRPDSHFTIRMDESAGIDLPALVDVTVMLKGPAGASLAQAGAEATRERRDDLTRGAVRALFPDFNLIDSAISADPVSGLTTVHTHGMVGAPWRFDRAGARELLDFARGQTVFDPDRARPAWATLPVAMGQPESLAYDLEVRLPDGGAGYRIEGDSDFSGLIAGEPIERHVRIDGDRVTMQFRHDTPAGGEVAPGDVAAAKLAAVRYAARAPALRAPRDAPRYWQEGDAARARYAALDAAYAAIIAARPDEAALHANRARFRRATFDRAGAYADYARALALEPTVALLGERAAMLEEDGRYAQALDDMRAAQAIDPGNHVVAARRAHLLLKLGRKAEALAVRQDELDNAGPGPAHADVVIAMAEVQSDAGQTREALATLDDAAREKPGNPDILNLQCWLKGTRQVMLDSALKDCTRAIELSESTAGALDSRAMVWYRLGRDDEALADLDAALDAQPGLASSLFMRAVIAARQGRLDAARTDLAAARRLAPAIERQFGDYGITLKLP